LSGPFLRLGGDPLEVTTHGSSLLLALVLDARRRGVLPRRLQAPFLVDSDALLDQATTGDLAAGMLAGLDGHGVKGLALIAEGLRHPFTFAEPFVTPADFAGKTIRTPRSESGYALFRALGAKRPRRSSRRSRH
jgi:hypothetical protein